MRFFKLFSITVVSILIIFAVTYNARILVINTLAKAPLSLIDLKVTCLDINFTNNMAIKIEQLCLQHSKVDIEIIDTVIQWKYKSNLEITDINIQQVAVKGKNHLIVNNKIKNTNMFLIQKLYIFLANFR